MPRRCFFRVASWALTVALLIKDITSGIPGPAPSKGMQQKNQTGVLPGSNTAGQKLEFVHITKSGGTSSSLPRPTTALIGECANSTGTRLAGH